MIWLGSALLRSQPFAPNELHAMAFSVLFMGNGELFCEALGKGLLLGATEFQGVRDMLILTLLAGTILGARLHMAEQDRDTHTSWDLDRNYQKSKLVLTRGCCAVFYHVSSESEMGRDEGFEVPVGSLGPSMLSVFVLARPIHCRMILDMDVDVPSGDCAIERV